MINEVLDKMGCGKIKNEALDVEVMHKKLYDITNKSFSIEELIKTYKIPKNDRNSVLEDAYLLALLFLKLKSKLGFK
jgi:DNA polymerase-3 subunit epsilon